VKSPHWIDPLALVLLHGETLAEHGGLSGLRDAAALESSLARPRHRYTYEPGADLAQLAASYGFGIVRNHPFVDGNKRVGFLAIGLFLSLNGFELTARPVDSVQTIFRLAAGELSEPQLAEWIRKHMTRHRRKAL
jgi:death-on-curing protein